MILKFVQHGNLKQVQDNGVESRFVYFFAKQYITDYHRHGSRYDSKDGSRLKSWNIQSSYATTFNLELIYEGHKFAEEIPF